MLLLDELLADLLPFRLLLLDELLADLLPFNLPLGALLLGSLPDLLLVRLPLLNDGLLLDLLSFDPSPGPLLVGFLALFLHSLSPLSQALLNPRALSVPLLELNRARVFRKASIRSRPFRVVPSILLPIIGPVSPRDRTRSPPFGAVARLDLHARGSDRRRRGCRRVDHLRPKQRYPPIPHWRLP